MGWLEYHQLFETFRQDKKNGFANEPSKFEIELLNNNTKIISRMYRLLLDWEVKEEEMKVVTIKWAQDIRCPIMMREWESLWKPNMKFTACYTIK